MTKWDVKISSSQVLLDFIQEFYEKYGVVPSTGFMAGIFKVSMTAIYYHLDHLDREGKIKKIKKIRNNQIYELV